MRMRARRPFEATDAAGDGARAAVPDALGKYEDSYITIANLL